MFLKRYDVNCSTQFLLKVNNKVYDCSFCNTCGQYLYSETNKNIRKIYCVCDNIPKIFQKYKSFIEEIPDICSGDELDDYIENPKDAGKNFMRYVYNIVLFGITYEKEYYKKIDDSIISKILEYTV